MSGAASRPPNRLAREKSPYLLEHARNPVDWYPWGAEAFARAKAEDKPIFLSIGYSTCHWCHVMERECFEDPTIAAAMNELFVNVKVDREERPDVDAVYMAFVQAATGAGGWPLSVFLTPDLEPFFGGTYFPPDDRHGRPGFPRLLGALAQAWRDRRGEVLSSGASIVAQLRRGAAETAPAVLLGPGALDDAYRIFEASFDREHGGFGGPPKFPRPATHHFLLRYFARTGREEAARMVHSTLLMMSRGGMYDHLGGGFHRYSVDRSWHVPHFEKMLYDQAELVVSLVEALQVTGDPWLARTARETCDYVLRDLTCAQTGGFLAAEDADSQVAPDSPHEAEGAFYVFTKEEIARALGPDLTPVFCFHYGVLAEGNAQDPHGELAGKNVLHVMHGASETAAHFGLSAAEASLRLTEARRVLFDLRNQRPRPHRDDKILCAWNGRMISALAHAHQVLGEPRYLAAAERAARFVRDRLWDEGRRTLHRRYRDGEVAIEGYAQDYAFLVAGLLDLYEAGFDLAWLLLAERLTERQLELFGDRDRGGFFSTSGQDPSVLVRMKDEYDGAEPSPNSVSAQNLLRMARLFDREDWAKEADRIFACFSARLREEPHAMPQLWAAYELALVPSTQVVLAGERQDPALGSLLRAVHERFVPAKEILLVDAQARPELAARLPWLADMAPRDGRPTAYVCKEHACQAPTSDPTVLRELLLGRRLEAAG